MAVRVGSAILRFEKRVAPKKPAPASKRARLALQRGPGLSEMAGAYMHVCMASFALDGVLGCVSQYLLHAAYWGVGPLIGIATACAILSMVLLYRKPGSGDPSNLVFWSSVAGGLFVGALVLMANIGSGLV